MITRHFRELTSAERARLALNAEAGRYRFGDALGVVGLIGVFYIGGGWCLGKLVNWLVFNTLLGRNGYPYLPTCGLMLGIAPFLVTSTRSMLHARRRRRQMMQQFEHAIRDGRAEVVSCLVHGAVELDEFDDEGPGYLLDVGEVTLLFVQGQHLMEHRIFPTSRVTITRVVATREEIGVESDGDYVAPQRRIDPAILGRDHSLWSGTFVRGTLHELEARLPALRSDDCDCLDEVVSPAR